MTKLQDAVSDIAELGNAILWWWTKLILLKVYVTAPHAVYIPEYSTIEEREKDSNEQLSEGE